MCNHPSMGRRARCLRDGASPRPSRDKLPLWLGTALALHAAALGLVSLHARPEPQLASPAPAARDVPALVWLDPSDPLMATGTPPAADEPASPGVPERARALAARPAAPASLDPARDELPRSALAASPAEQADGEAGVSGGESHDTPAEPRRLSLSELGVGAANNPFTREPPPRLSERQVLNRRLRQSLMTSLARQDQERGLGPEGPAVEAVTRIVMESATQPNTSGLLVIHTDAAGLTRSVEVLEASNDAQGWQRIARELSRALAGKKLRVPQRSGGISMQLRVTSRTQLPSGADPGLAVELFGQTIKAGSGQKSARLKILSPGVTVSELPVPYATNGASMPVVGFSPNVLALGGDLSDIGAVARRIVNAHLVALDVRAPDRAAPDPHSAVDSPARAP